MLGKLLDLVKDVRIKAVEISSNDNKVIISIETDKPQQVKEALYSIIKNYGFIAGIDIKKVVINE